MPTPERQSSYCLPVSSLAAPQEAPAGYQAPHIQLGLIGNAPLMSRRWDRKSSVN